MDHIKAETETIPMMTSDLGDKNSKKKYKKRNSYIPTKEELLQLERKTSTIKELAEHLNMSESKVYYLRKKYGIKKSTTTTMDRLFEEEEMDEDEELEDEDEDEEIYDEDGDYIDGTERKMNTTLTQSGPSLPSFHDAFSSFDQKPTQTKGKNLEPKNPKPFQSQMGHFHSSPTFQYAPQVLNSMSTPSFYHPSQASYYAQMPGYQQPFPYPRSASHHYAPQNPMMGYGNYWAQNYPAPYPPQQSPSQKPPSYPTHQNSLPSFRDSFHQPTYDANYVYGPQMVVEPPTASNNNENPSNVNAAQQNFSRSQTWAGLDQNASFPYALQSHSSQNYMQHPQIPIPQNGFGQ